METSNKQDQMRMLKIALFFILSEGTCVFEEVLQGESCISHLQRFHGWSSVQTYPWKTMFMHPLF